MGILARRTVRVEAMQSLLAAAQAQPGNLAMTLQQLRQHCLPDEDCDALIRAALAGYPDAEFAALAEQALTRLPLYELAMQDVVMSMSTPPRERYDAIHALREQTLGRDVTEALFGQEAAWAEYQFRYGDLMEAADALSAADRIAALNALRDSSFGDYADALQQVEGIDGRYQRELALLLAGIDDASTRAQITRDLRQHYYPADVVAQREQRDRQQQLNDQRVLDYQQAVAALQQDMAAVRETLSDQAWQQQYEQALGQLRAQYFP
ncbi:lipase chaperone [Alcanivorax sp. JB21]|uniref:lipase chaperone n=1 Tax=Alcanivorax limicola TaxID=2874102 RepID=UPI001CC1779F|nr:lipase chaperone [Alcanivorax limicola]MBZ2188271.1 lipase chaperone [Alcanivorax limicola]